MSGYQQDFEFEQYKKQSWNTYIYLFAGGRGLDHYKWSSAVSNLDEILNTLNVGLADQSMVDVLDLEYNETTPVTSLTAGYLVVPSDGDYTFMLTGQNCNSRLSLSNSSHENYTVPCPLLCIILLTLKLGLNASLLSKLLLVSYFGF